MKLYIKVLFAAILFVSFFSCKKDKLLTESGIKLNFSIDTVQFDTVFASVGSATKRFIVHNTYDQPIKVSEIYLAGGSNSNFMINIDGANTRRVSDVEIPANDSLFIFVQVTVDPNNISSPMVIQDSIVFSTNGYDQDIDLVAWGQDVVLIDGDKNGLIQTTTWTSEKPYLIYNSMAVDSGHTLTITAGTQLHFSFGSALYVYPTATIVVEGDVENPVVFQGDRLEEIYDDVPGQWQGIWLMQKSKDNVFKNAIVKNAVIGIRVDTVGSANPTLIMHNTRIEHMTFAGLYALGSQVVATNCVFADCANYAVALLYGGGYHFYHCTMANYPTHGNRQTPALIINNYFVSDNTPFVRSIYDTYFGNCIIYGNKDVEVEFDSYDDAYMEYQFDHCLMKVNPEMDISDETKYKNIIINEDPEFVDVTEYDYQLDTLSPAIDKGDINIVTGILDLDLNGNQRDELPDLGAFERIDK